jgi:hypothetical protein
MLLTQFDAPRSSKQAILIHFKNINVFNYSTMRGKAHFDIIKYNFKTVFYIVFYT